MLKIKILLFIAGLGFLVFNEVGVMKLITLYNDNKDAQNHLNQRNIKR